MHIIWKRPDGFQNAQPEDFRRVSLSNGAQLWLHRHELDWYPFQVSGDWEGKDQTIRLNRLVNMLDATDSAWKSYLEHFHDNDFGDASSAEVVAKGFHSWLEELKQVVKGHTWEIDIIKCALSDAQNRLKKFRE